MTIDSQAGFFDSTEQPRPDIGAVNDSDSFFQVPEHHQAAFAQITAIQQQKSSWINMLLMLFVTLAIFVGTGSAGWSWEYLAMLIPILLLHESGHYVAMKLSGYSNLKMFFIPFFGAAVSGRSHNVAGWKKAVVYLAGPVPGIVLGAVVGTVGLATRLPWLVHVASLSLIVNGMNLIPLLPLDGGRIAQELFFSRHYVIDVVFRLFTVLGLAAVGYLLGDVFLFVLAAITALGISGALRAGRIVHRIRQTRIDWSSESNDVPPETAVRILDEVEKDFPSQGLNPKLKAQITLGIFESLNSHPPGIGATILLSIVHAASFFAAIVFLLLIVVGQQKLRMDPGFQMDEAGKVEENAAF